MGRSMGFVLWRRKLSWAKSKRTRFRPKKQINSTKSGQDGLMEARGLSPLLAIRTFLTISLTPIGEHRPELVVLRGSPWNERNPSPPVLQSASSM